MLAHGLDARGPLRSILSVIFAPLIAAFLIRPLAARAGGTAVGVARDGDRTRERPVAGAGRSVRIDRHSVRAAGGRRRVVPRPRDRVSLHAARHRPHPLRHRALHHARGAHAGDAAAAGDSAGGGNRHSRSAIIVAVMPGTPRSGICIRADAAGTAVSRAALVRRFAALPIAALLFIVVSPLVLRVSVRAIPRRLIAYVIYPLFAIALAVSSDCLGRRHAAAQPVRGWPFDDSGRGDDARRAALSRRRAGPRAHFRRVARFRSDETRRRRRGAILRMRSVVAALLPAAVYAVALAAPVPPRWRSWRFSRRRASPSPARRGCCRCRRSRRCRRCVRFRRCSRSRSAPLRCGCDRGGRLQSPASSPSPPF